MIFLYSGTPGSGKSLHQASDFWYGFKYREELFITNYTLNYKLVGNKFKGGYLYLDNLNLTPENLRKIADNWWQDHKFREGGIKLYVDEAQMLFNARSWDAKDRKGWNDFFQVHRHYGYDIYLIAQFDRMLDRQIRSLIEYEVIHRKVSNFGLKGKILSLVMGGNMFVAIKMWYPLKERVSSEFFRYRKKFSNLYDSYKRFDVEEETAVGGEPDDCNTADSSGSAPLPPDCDTKNPNIKLLKRILPYLLGFVIFNIAAFLLALLLP